MSETPTPEEEKWTEKAFEALSKEKWFLQQQNEEQALDLNSYRGAVDNLNNQQKLLIEEVERLKSDLEYQRGIDRNQQISIMQGKLELQEKNKEIERLKKRVDESDVDYTKVVLVQLDLEEQLASLQSSHKELELENEKRAKLIKLMADALEQHIVATDWITHDMISLRTSYKQFLIATAQPLIKP